MLRAPARTPLATHPIIGLLTDFGTSDHYVGTMKAVILSRNPQARIVDISHGVLPQQIQQGGYLLWSAYRFFLPGTIFIGVVDPGVGSGREILIVKTKRYIFVAPENGLLDLALSGEELKTAVRVNRQNPKLFGKEISPTFHGRDIFAPLAAVLARGVNPATLGTKVHLPKPLPPLVDSASEVVKPVILHIDRFGNLVTNIVARAAGEKPRLSVGFSGRGIFSAWISHYAEGPDRTPCLIAGSSGLVEIVVKNDSAARLLNVNVGSPIKVYWQ